MQEVLTLLEDGMIDGFDVFGLNVLGERGFLQQSQSGSDAEEGGGRKETSSQLYSSDLRKENLRGRCCWLLT